MVAAINFFADTFGITNLNGSGLGFFGGGFGQSVNVGEYQKVTFITNSAGTAQGPQVNNIQYIAGFGGKSGIVGSATSGILLTQIPNYLATLNIRFTNDIAVKTQNVKMRIYDRVSIDSAPSGVLSQVAELIHTDTIQNNNGSGNSVWSSLGGSGVVLTLAQSPGASGAFAGNGTTSTYADVRHDNYVAISQSPSTIGSKLSAVYISLEYL
jgi:hypothetical protein